MFQSGFNFNLGDTADLLSDAVQEFAQAEIAPLAADIDRANEFPAPLWRKMGELGLLGITVAEQYGGSDMGYLAHILAMQQISRASASVGLSYGAHSNLCINQIHLNGSAEQKQRYLPALVAGEQVGALEFVSHCYLRLRALPDWPYNLFAMIHGSSRDEVAVKRAEIRGLLGDALRGDDILYSTKILKKTGLRLGKG